MVVAPPNEWPMMAALLISSLPWREQHSKRMYSKSQAFRLTATLYLKLFEVEVSIHHVVDINAFTQLGQ